MNIVECCVKPVANTRSAFRRLGSLAFLALLLVPLEESVSAEPGAAVKDQLASAGSKRTTAAVRFTDALSNGDAAPEMVRVAGGRFTMGSPQGEADRQDNEGPRHAVEVKGFTISRTEITRAQFARFVRATNYKTDAERNTPVRGKEAFGCKTFADSFVPDWLPGTNWRDPRIVQQDDHPVVCVSFNDAIAYAKWLTDETGQRYRLPTEAEMEYVIRAGSETVWPWGISPTLACTYGNVADASGKKGFRERFGFMSSLLFSVADCDDGFAFTAPVGKLKPNQFGVHDTVGNVYEWTMDCGSGGYVGAPEDGSAWTTSHCEYRMIRGSAYSDQPEWTRSAVRIATSASNRYHNIGIRIARDL